MFAKTCKFPDFQYYNPFVTHPTYIGHEWIETEDYIWDTNQHKAVPHHGFFQFSLSGAGRIQIKKKKIRLDPGMGFILFTDEAHRYWYEKKTADHWEFLWIGFSGQNALSLLGSIQKEFGRIVSLPLQSQTINLLKDMHGKTMAKAWSGQMQISATGYQFLLQLIEDLRNRGTQDAHERIEQSIIYINGHYMDPIDISIVSPRFGYTREHFTRLFRLKTGTTPGQYVQNIRLVRAKELLRSTRLSLDIISLETGLGSANYLCHLFKRKFQMTPHQYRHSREAAIGL